MERELTTPAPARLAATAPPPGAKPKGGTGPRGCPDLSGTSILVVDDHAGTRDWLAFALGRAGALVERAGGGKAAIECLARARYDIVMLDLRMDDLDGFAVLERCPDRADAFVMMTAEADPHNRQRARDLGAHDLLAKPFDLPRLHQVLEKLLSRSV